VGDLPDRVRELLPDGVVDELLAGAQGEEEIVGPGGLLSQLTKRLVERAMEVELTDHLGYEPHLEPPGGTGNARNGSTPKTLMTEHGPVAIAIEALNRQLRKAVKTKGHFPTEDAARKLIYLAIGNAVPQWTRTRGWTKAMLAFKIYCETSAAGW
jgi:transposase-like protein